MPGTFEGWYFKQQAGRDMLAVIPAVHTDGRGRQTGSIQLITPDASWFIPLPGEALCIRRKPLAIITGDSMFSRDGLELNISGNGLRAEGRLHYGSLSPPQGDIMGPYRFVPLMECRHSVFSMGHDVSGSVSINGRPLDFTGGVGYIEGDRGRSFPKRYVWAQCNWGDDQQNNSLQSDPGRCSLMISAADVQPLGRAFIGVIGFVWLRGRELRLATYRGAKVASAGGGALVIKQGEYTLTAERFDAISPGQRTVQELRAPAAGDMVRLIKESLSCRARFTLTDGSSTIFDLTTDQASFEYEL